MLSLLAFLFKNIFMVSYVGHQNSFPPPLSAEKEEEYIIKYENGDEDARNILIEHNLRLVAHVVKKYQDGGIDPDDLISIGTIGLIKAVSTYDSKKRIRMATYAARCIENEVLMAFRARKKTANEVSLNEPLGVDKAGNEINLIDVLQNDDDDIIDDFEIKSQKGKLYQAIKNHLQKREKIIIEARYGLFGKKEKTQREIAESMGISRSYVSRIEKKALEKLKMGIQG